MTDKKRRFLPIAAIAAVALVAAACSSSSDGDRMAESPPPPPPALPMMVDLSGVTNGSNAEAGTIEVGAGMSMDSGNTAFECGAGGDDCTVTVTVDADDGTVSATSTGGMVMAGNSAAYTRCALTASAGTKADGHRHGGRTDGSNGR